MTELYIAIVVAVVVVLFVVGLVVYKVRTHDKCALPGITEFDRARLPMHLLVDHSFGIRFREAVQEAAESWNEWIGADWFIYPGATGVAGSLVTIDPYRGSDEDSKHKKAFAYTYLAVNKAGNGITGAAVLVNTPRHDLSDVSITVLRNVLAHEFGHCLGLAHDEIPNSIMHPKVRQGAYADAALTQHDVDFLRQAYGERRQRRV